MERTKSSIPFVGLHAHSVAGSPFDALGYPQEHMDFAYKNGCDALALTDHGNMNGLSYQIIHAKKMKADGKEFKPIFGVEAYFVPSVEEWKKDYEKAKEDKKQAKSIKKGSEKITAEDESASKRKSGRVTARSHLILLAQNQEGLNNIFKLISESFQGDNFYRYPRVDFDLLKKHNKGIIASSACLGGVYATIYWNNRDEGPEAVLREMRKTTQRMIDIFGDRWYGELQWHTSVDQHNLNHYVLQMKKEFGIKVISTADSHYPNPDAWKDRELYKRLGILPMLIKYKDKPENIPDWLSPELPEELEEVGHELYPKNGDQMWEAYKHYSQYSPKEYDDDEIRESIAITHDIAHNRIESFLPDNEVRLPDFLVPPGQTATETLVVQCIEGLKNFGFARNKEYVDRLKHELKVIDDRGFSKYFLTMKAIADKANQKMLSGPGRGSAAGSLVAYVLGITQVDPIKYGLLFSRFLRADAKDYPDIDYDVSDAFGLKEFLAEEWGDKRVVPISNFNTLQLRSLIKDISRFYDIPFREANSVTSVMVSEATPKAKAKHGIKAGVYNPTFEEVMLYSESLQRFLRKYPDVKTHVETLFGQVKSISRHAGGVVIGEDLDKHMPLISSGGVIQTPWSEGQNVRHLEPLGFIKFDLLGLSTLEMIESAVRHLLQRHHGIEEPTYEDVRKWYDENLHPESINLNDEKVYKNIFHKGNFVGTFQFTNEGAQKFCKRAKPNNIIDISAITSIYRPGPLSAKVDRDYVEAKRNPGDIHYVNDIVKEITEETAGFLIFQEQIALLANKLGKDISLDEANLLRKLLTKKGTGKGAREKEKIRTKFVQGCLEKKIDRVTADAMWEKFEYFSGYGFNKSHAVSYSILSYQCAWLYNYYPECWVAAFLDKEPEARKEAAINLAQKYGFKIQKVNINKSTERWEILNKDTLIQPLNSIKGLGDKAIEQILSNRPFNDAEELLFNEDIVYSKLNKKALQALCESGALNTLVDDRFTGLKHFWNACVMDRPKTKKKLLTHIDKYRTQEDFTPEERIEHISSRTGIYPFDLVISDEIRDALDRHKVPPLGSWDHDLKRAWFIPQSITKKKTKTGREFWIVKVIDETSTITTIRCWGIIKGKDIIHLNRVYVSDLDYNPVWGFSTKSVRQNFILLG